MAKKKRNVYVTNLNNHDLCNITDFTNGGKIIPITKGRINIFDLDSLLNKISLCVKEFDSKNDYLLIIGNSIVTAACVFVLKHYVNKVNLLIFDARNNIYKHSKMELKND